MRYKQKTLCAMVIMACGGLSTQAQATLPSNAILSFDAGVVTSSSSGTTFVKSGSYFGMDTNGDSLVRAAERTAISINNGLAIGTAQDASGTHSGAPDGSEVAGIDSAWSFFGNTGLHYTIANVTKLSDDNAGIVTLDFSGWGVAWNGIPRISMATSAWESNADGVANLVCAVDCAEGDTFTLNYSATVPAGDVSGFGNVKYNLEMVGTITVINAAPVSSDFTVATIAGTTTEVNVAVNAADADGNLDSASVIISNDTSCETITNNADGTISLPSCPASTYTFNYTISDTNNAVSNASTVTVNVSANPAPNTAPDSGNTNGATPVTIDVAANDSDNGTLDHSSVAIVSAANNGGTSIDASSGAITYTANSGFSGVDTFTYSINDDTAQTSAATLVTVTVNAMNTPSSNGTFSPGSTSSNTSSANGLVTADDIGVADNGSTPEQGISQTCLGGCFDFVITGITSNAQIVLPLSTAIAAPAEGNSLVYRKLTTAGWVNFDISGDNAIDSVAGTVSGTDVVCPPATDTSYDASPGLVIGNRCVRLTIVDDGPNDDDPTTGTVTDPGGIAETFSIDTRTSGTDGCSMSANPVSASQRADWLLVAGFIGLLGLFRLKKSNKA